MGILTVRNRPEVPYLLARLQGSTKRRRLSFVLSLVSGDEEARQLVKGTIQAQLRLLPDYYEVAWYPSREDVEVSPGLRKAARIAIAELQDALASLGDVALDFPITVFAQAGADVVVDEWFRVVQAHFSLALVDEQKVATQSARQLEVVVSPTRRDSSLAPLEQKFQLPVNVVAPPEVVDALLETEEYLRDADVSENVLNLRIRSDSEKDPAGTDLSIRAFEDSWEAVDWLGNDTIQARVRVALVRWNSGPAIAAPRAIRRPRVLPAVRLAENTACITIETLDRTNVAELRFLRAFVRALVADNPLSTAIAIARREIKDDRGNVDAPFVIQEGQGRLYARLYCDPSANNWLRFSRSIGDIEKEAQRLRHFAENTNFRRLAHELAIRESNTGVLGQFAETLNAADNVASSSADALSLGINFSGESSGIVPMARVLHASRSAAIGDFLYQLELLSDNPELLEALEEVQQRRVNAKLEIREENGIFRCTHAGLTSGVNVRLTVHIGQRSRDSLVDDDVPAIDPMLPELAPSESHEIDIVVFPKDFRLDDSLPACQTVQLPRFGGTKPVTWNLTAPVLIELTPETSASPQEPMMQRLHQDGDEAELRFNIYFRNQLLQSFTLTSTILRERPWRGRSRVQCDFSQSSRFGRLDRLGERFATFALNKGSNDSHLLSLRSSKRDSCSVQWQGSFLSARLTAVRTALLQSLTSEEDGPLFAFELENLSCSPTRIDAFEAAVRRLAKVGTNLCNQLAFKDLDPSSEVLGLLAEIQGSSDKIIQVALLDPSYTLPWGLLYDYKVEDDGWANLPVCNGFGRTNVRCNCRPDGGRTICLRGFWGFRHYIEQLCGVRGSDPDSARIIANKPTSPSLAFVQGVDDEFSNRLAELLTTEVPASKHVSTPVSLLKQYASPDSRPAVILFVGHLEEDDAADAGTAKLVNRDNTTFLSVGEIGWELRQQKFWTEPRSLVLLMACGSGRQAPDAGVGLSGALVRLNAMGVLGTECRVATGIASRMARDVLLKLNDVGIAEVEQRKTIGVALREAVWDLALEGCPLGLAFTYVGSIEATLP
ncbi:MAG: hypothetical protein Q7U73_12785 [Rubrivivax sp.]|nr:hypothetical protein [Rubrivivax sp.]